MDDIEVVALVLPEDGDTIRTATIVLRDAHGSMSVRQIATDDELLRSEITARFRMGKPILDPNSREVLGYEMERRALAATDQQH
jgi:hypothetical protein